MTDPINLAERREQARRRKLEARTMTGRLKSVPAMIGASLGNADPLDPNEPKPTGGDAA